MTTLLKNQAMAVEELSYHYRLTSLIRLPAATGRDIQNEATLYHDRGPMRVSWRSSAVDSRLKRGCLVNLMGVTAETVGDEGACLRIGRLKFLDKPLASANPFLSIPPAWIADRDLVHRAAALWEQLSSPFQHLLNAVLWEGGRFYRYVTESVSTADYPWVPGSNFRQAVATAEEVALLTCTLDDVSSSVVIVAAMLSNAGKAEDYWPSAGCALSERGYRIDRQHTILEWLAAAQAWAIVPEAQYVALVHALIASRCGTAYGQTAVAAILAVASRLQRLERRPLAAFPGMY